MKWMRERDLLIAQTMAFVQSVTGKRPDADRPAAHPVAARPLPDIEAMLTEAITNPDPPKPIEISRAALRSEYRTEVQARVANFRAHQERFSREREEYCRATMAKVQASLAKDAPSRLGK